MRDNPKKFDGSIGAEHSVEEGPDGAVDVQIEPMSLLQWIVVGDKAALEQIPPFFMLALLETLSGAENLEYKTEPRTKSYLYIHYRAYVDGMRDIASGSETWEEPLLSFLTAIWSGQQVAETLRPRYGKAVPSVKRAFNECAKRRKWEPIFPANLS